VIPAPKRTPPSARASRGKKALPHEPSPLLPARLQAVAHSYGYWQDVPWAVVNADACRALKALPDNSVDCVVTSPPYYWQRDYGVKGQSGQEDTVAAYVANLTRVFRHIRRAHKKTGVAFLVLGDTYYSGRGRPHGGDPKQIWRSVAREKYRAVDRPGMGLPRTKFRAASRTPFAGVPGSMESIILCTSFGARPVPGGPSVAVLDPMNPRVAG
jgi:hypothetical protein